MNKEEFEKFLKDRYRKETDWYDRESIKNHKYYRFFQWSAIALSAMTPILILIGIDWVRWIAVGTGALVAISTAALKTFKYQENWINYRTTCETLRKEIHFYNAGIQGYECMEDKEALFIERVESLISRENTLWVVTHEKEEPVKHK